MPSFVLTFSSLPSAVFIFDFVLASALAGAAVAPLAVLSATGTVVAALSAALPVEVLVIEPVFGAVVSATGFTALGTVVSDGVPGRLLAAGLVFVLSGGVVCADAAPTIPRRRKENNSFFID